MAGLTKRRKDKKSEARAREVRWYCRACGTVSLVYSDGFEIGDTESCAECGDWAEVVPTADVE